MPDQFGAQVERIAALGEPVRRALYQYVAAQERPVGREQAAAGVGVAHHTAKFHLDKLVTDGLLDVEYARPPGRSGPGAGRPAKLYRRSARDISVSLPDRRYDLAGRVLAEAITTATQSAVPITEALRIAATAIGRDLAAEAQQPEVEPPGVTPRHADGDDARESAAEASAAEIVSAVLACNGYEPRTAEGEIVLANCPFHSLAQTYTELVCGMNLGVIDGLLGGLGCTDLQARLCPGPDRCCVTISAASGEEPTAVR